MEFQQGEKASLSVFCSFFWCLSSLLPLDLARRQVPASAYGYSAVVCDTTASQVAERANGQNLRRGDQVVASGSASASSACKRNADAGGEHQGQQQPLRSGLHQRRRLASNKDIATAQLEAQRSRGDTQTRHMLVEREDRENPEGRLLLRQGGLAIRLRHWPAPLRSGHLQQTR